MFCPNCGEKNSETQNFCRACGLGLEEISNALAVQRPRGVDVVKAEKSALDKAGEVGMIGLGGIGLIAVGWFIYKIFVGFVLSGVAPMLGLLGMVGTVCAVLTLIWVVRRGIEEDKRSSSRLAPQHHQSELQPRDAGQLTEGIAQPASVTERTTRNLS